MRRLFILFAVLMTVSALAYADAAPETPKHVVMRLHGPQEESIKDDGRLAPNVIAERRPGWVRVSTHREDRAIVLRYERDGSQRDAHNGGRDGWDRIDVRIKACRPKRTVHDDDLAEAVVAGLKEKGQKPGKPVVVDDVLRIPFTGNGYVRGVSVVTFVKSVQNVRYKVSATGAYPMMAPPTFDDDIVAIVRSVRVE